jgi:hypothetical protein
MSSPGEDPAIHSAACAGGSMDARVEPAHDSEFDGRQQCHASNR